MNLPKFPPARASFEAKDVLPYSGVVRVINFVLGPAGTNMEQSYKAWIQKNRIQDKSEIVLCPTPEDSLAQARTVTEIGTVPLFWTCAVYYKLNELFFNNPDTYPFVFHFYFTLDNMQLCVRTELASLEWGSGWRIASHPSPAPLVRGLESEVVLTTSNAQAALMCASGQVEACITTQQAARIHGLATVHEFGSPTMVFFAGTTQHGMDVMTGR